MKIAHYSDTHARHDKEKIEEVDFLIHTGDFCSIDFTVSELEGQNAEITFNQALNFLKWLKQYPARYKIITSGNHEAFLNDPGYREEFEALTNKAGIIFKDDLGVITEVGGLRIAGAGSYPAIADYMTQKHAYFFREGHYNQIPDEQIDILITHACPEISDNQFECPDLRYFVKDREDIGLPIPLLLCGHIHESRGAYSEGATKILNSACKGHVFIHEL